MTDHARLLERETEAAKLLRDQLTDLAGDDEDVIRDTLEGETQLHELIKAVIEQEFVDQAHVDGISEHIKTMNARKDRLKRRIEARRVVLLAAMQVGELKNLHLATATITRKAVPQKAQVISEADIPARFWKPQPPKLDLKELTSALKDKEQVEGATLSNGGETVMVRKV